MSNQAHIETLLEEALRTHVFSGYQLYAEAKGKTAFDLAGGVTAYWPGATPVTPATYFDLASLTKVILTTSLLALAVDQKKISLTDTIAKYVPSLDGVGVGERQVGQLLEHGGGLCGWISLAATLKGEGLVEWLKTHSSRLCENPIGQMALYSDVDFWLLGLVAERVWGSLDKALEKEICEPLGLKELRFGPLLDKSQVAATEFSTERGRLLWGEVFDENTFTLGGVAAHAGLFGTARGLAGFCKEWIKARNGKSSWLTGETALLFSKKVGRVPQSSWAYGWDTRSPVGSSAGQHFSLKSFGHLGFTGTSLWIDPEAEAYVVFLSNRVHPSRDDDRIRRLRPRLHDAVREAWKV